MYYQILLYRLLDCVNIISLNQWNPALKLLPFFKEKAELILSWLKTITFIDGEIPMVNDSAYGIGPSYKEIFNYADALNLKYSILELKDLGYRMFKNNKFELFIDVGNVGPNYQPAHVHSDTFNFLLNKKSKPIFVDIGVSTYEKNKQRNEQRSTESHNTIIINQTNQTQVWGGFRVAKRAEIVNLNEGKNYVSATHNGYKGIGVFHTRKFQLFKGQIIISDSFTEEKDNEKIAYFHLPPNLKEKFEIIDNKLILVEEKIDVIASAPNRYDTYEIKALAKEKRGNNLTIYRVDLPKHDGGILARAKTSVSYYKKVLSITKKNNYDLVYASSSRLMTAFLGAKIAKKNKKTKLYLDIRDIFRETISDVFKNKIVAKSLSFLFKYIEEYTCSRANHINLVSQGFESYFKKIKKCNYTFFINDIDEVFLNHSEIEKTNSGQEIKTIIYAGNIGEGQGLDTIIPKVARALEKTHIFVVYGDEGIKYKLVKKLKDNKTLNVDILNPIKRNLLI